MQKIKDILDTTEEFTMDEFWAVIDALPDESDGKKHKDNIRKYFKKDGTPKVKALSPSTDEDYQSIYDTEVFIHTTIAKEIHLNKLRYHVAVHKQHIKDIRKKKIERHKIVKYGKLKPIKKKEGKSAQQEVLQLDPILLRNQLASEYNRLIRENNPDTKELREQIHAQIQKIEETESHVTN